MSAPQKGYRVNSDPVIGFSLPQHIRMRTTESGTDAELDKKRPTSFTVEAWVYTHSLGSSQALLSGVERGGGWNGRGIYLYQRDDVGEGWSFTVTDTGGNTRSTRYGEVLIGQWQHVAFTYSDEGKGLSSIAIDGTVLGTDQTFARETDNLGIGPEWIGGNTTDGPGDIEIARVRFWNKALSESEIQQTMAAETPDPDWPFLHNLLGSYKLDSNYKNEPADYGRTYAILPGNSNTWEPEPGIQVATRVSGAVNIEGKAAARAVRAFSYAPTAHSIDEQQVSQAKSLGQAKSDPDSGEYTIELLGGYQSDVFVVAFDDYGQSFTPNLEVTAGDRVHPSTPDGYVYRCEGSGTLPETEPDWVADTETSKLYGTASMIAVPFYRPMVHGPITPEILGEITYPYLETVKAMSPLMYYPLGKETQDTIKDESGNGHDTSWVAVPAEQAQPPLTSGGEGSVTLNAGGRFLSGIAKDPANEDITLSFWFETLGSIPDQMGLIHQEDGSGKGRHWIHIGWQGNFENLFGGSPSGLGADIQTNTLYHLVMTIAPDGHITFWINGSKTADINKSVESATGRIKIARSDTVGRLSDVAIWGRILTDIEILELYNAGTE